MVAIEISKDEVFMSVREIARVEMLDAGIFSSCSDIRDIEIGDNDALLVWASNFEQMSLVPQLVVTPLIFLGGTFYSISMLPERRQHRD